MQTVQRDVRLIDTCITVTAVEGPDADICNSLRSTGKSNLQ